MCKSRGSKEWRKADGKQCKLRPRRRKKSPGVKKEMQGNEFDPVR